MKTADEMFQERGYVRGYYEESNGTIIYAIKGKDGKYRFTIEIDTIKGQAAKWELNSWGQAMKPFNSFEVHAIAKLLDEIGI